MSRKVVLTIIGFVAIILIIVGIKGHSIYSAMQKFKHMEKPGETVAVANSKAINWTNRLSAIGTVTAINGVDVTSQINGQVDSINFDSGQMVKKGQVLVHLDDSVEKAQMANYQAQMIYNRATFKRQKSLFSTNAAAKSSLDEAVSEMAQAQANIEKENTLIEQKTIRAPFSGKLGIRKVNLGQYVNPGDAMVSLQTLDPLYVNFSLPEQDLSKVKVGQKVGVHVDSYPGIEFTGKLTAVSPLIAEDTRMIQLQATLPNHHLKLTPGVFADVKVYLPMRKDVVVVPQTAITYRLYGDSVYLAKDSGKKDKHGKPIINAVTQYVTVGPAVDNRVIVEKGLKANVAVVTAGQIKLQNNSRIIPDTTIKMD